MKDFSRHERHLFLKGYEADWRPDSGFYQGLPEPMREKPVPLDAPRIRLPAPDGFDLKLADAMRERRSRRDFIPEPLTLRELSLLLWSTQGVTAQSSDGGPALRTAPSAGGRYPLETYVLSLRVDGVPPGIHRYLPDTHELVAVREDAKLAGAIEAACYGDPIFANAAAVVVWTAIPARTEWKYAYLSPRMIAMEAGHACQNLYLAAEAAGAGCCAMLAYDQNRMDALLGVDGEEEFVIYLAAVGKAARR